MNVGVIGLGSMGKRRIRLIKEMYPDYRIVGVDEREDRRQETSELFCVSCYSSISQIDSDMNCVFVCTSPLSHASIISDCLMHGWNVFTELNLVSDKYFENINLAKDNNCILFLSSTFLYREETRYISSRISGDKKWNYIYHVGQYLPDWHPWENYSDFFIGNKRTNGCREIMAIELPWLVDAFGDIESMKSVSDNITELNIGFNDNYIIQTRHKNGNKGALIIDVVSPVAIRKMEAYSENSYLSWDGTPDTIREFDEQNKIVKNVKLNEVAEHTDGYSSFIVENAYKNEIREFFDVIFKGKTPLYGFEKDKKILDLIDSVGA